MKFLPLPLPGAFLIELERKEDERGFFARSYCESEFSKQGIAASFPQCNVSYNKKKGTLRGMHYSIPPAAEAKLIRCTKGAVYDVLVDLRTDSPAYLKWTGVELSETNRNLLYVPVGIAHGFQTLEDATEMFYQMSVPFDPACARGVRWNDPKLNIKWPISQPILSPKDQELPTVSA